MKAALVIGVEHYLHHTQAIYASADAKGIVAALQRHCGFERGDIAILPEQTDARAIRARLTGASRLGRGDLLLFYFAGHGFYHDDDTFLVGHDAPSSAEEAIAGSVSLTWLLQAVDDIGAEHTVVLCDCCRTRTATPGRAIDEDQAMPRLPGRARALIPRQMPFTRERAVLFGCSPTQQTWPDPNAEHGVFTSALLEAFEHAVTRHGLVTAASVADDVHTRLQAWTEKQPGRAMTPQFLSTPGQIVLATGRKAATVNGAVPAWFRFTNGDRADDLESWFTWLLDHPSLCAEQFRDPERVGAWLRRSINPQAADGHARELVRHPSGIWTVLTEVAHQVTVPDRLSDLLIARRDRVNDLLTLADGDREYFANLARLDEAEKLDPDNPLIPRSRAMLQERLCRLGFQPNRRDVLDEAGDLFRAGEWGRAIRIIEVAVASAPLGEEEVRRLAGVRGTAVLEDLDGVEFVRMPPGIVQLHTGRIAALRPFSISRHPVKVGDYRQTLPLPAMSPPENPTWIAADRSIVYVDWHDARRHCEIRHGLLPSEAQWEYVRRFAADMLEWPRLSEWCRDVFRTPPLEPALDPWDDVRNTVTDTHRVVRRTLDSRASKRATDRDAALSFRLVLPVDATTASSA